MRKWCGIHTGLFCLSWFTVWVVGRWCVELRGVDGHVHLTFMQHQRNDFQGFCRIVDIMFSLSLSCLLQFGTHASWCFEEFLAAFFGFINTKADSFAFERLVFVKDRYDFKISEDAAQNPCRRWDVCCLGYFFIRFWQLIPLLPSLWRMSRLNISLCEPNWAQMLQRLCSSVSCFVLLWKLIARLLFRDEKCG